MTEHIRRARQPSLIPVLWTLVLVGIGLVSALISARAEAPTPLDAVYLIDGEAVRLTGGGYERPSAPGSASLFAVKSAGQPALGDLDGDGVPDAVFWLRVDPGGSGTFYYLAAAIRGASGYAGGNAVFIGDRIDPQDLSITQGMITASFLDRETNSPMAAPPTIKAVLLFRYNSGDWMQAETGPNPP